MAAPDRARSDVNNVDMLIAASNDGQYAPVSLYANPTSHALLTQGVDALIPAAYDYIAYTNTSTTVDAYVYKSGGSGGTTIATITITYTDTTKGQISTVART